MNASPKKLALLLAIVTTPNFIQADVAKPATTPAKETTKLATPEVKTAGVKGDLESSNLKIGYVNAMEVMTESEQGKKASEKINNLHTEKSKAVKEEEERISKKFKEYETQKTAFNAETRLKKESELTKAKSEYEQLVKDSENELKLAMQQLTTDLSIELEKTVTEIAQKENYDAIVDSASGRAVYVKREKADISDKLIKAMDKKYAENNKKPATAAKSVTA